MKTITRFLILLTLISSARAQIGGSFTANFATVWIPSTTQTNNDAVPAYAKPVNTVNGLWQAGVQGGIPQYSTIFTTLTTATAANSASINAALAAATAAGGSNVVFLNAGTYNLSDTMTLTSYTVLRGATNSSGAPTTVFNMSVGGGQGQINILNSGFPCEGGQGSTCSGTVYSNNIIAGLTRGSTNITLAAPVSNLATGQILALDQLADNINTFDYGPNPTSGESPHDTDWARNGTRAYEQYVTVTSWSGSTIFFTPAIYGDYWTNSLAPAAYWWSANSAVVGAGIENIAVNRTPSSASYIVWMGPAINCWVKNLVTSSSGTAVVRLEAAVFCEVDHCGFTGPPDSAGSGVYAFFLTTSSACKIENNWNNNLPTLISCAGASGNVIAYNYGTNYPYSTTTFLDEVMNASHGAHCYFNLFEGNYEASFWADGYHGNGSHTLTVRNSIPGWDPGKTGSVRSYNLDYYMDYMSAVDNVLGTPGIQTAYITPGTYCDQCIFNLENDTNIPPRNFLRVDNWNTVSNAIPAFEALPANTIVQNSYYLTNKPSWFGALNWPPYDAGNPSERASTLIPAGYRFLNGVDP